MDNKWFDESGYFTGEFSEEIVSACSHSGPCDSDVEYWQNELQFNCPRKQAVEYLKDFGAWDEDELQVKNDDEISQIILWIACGEIQEEGEWIGLIH